jgi:hypothetical protein
MISHTTERFRKVFAGLPMSVQKQARAAYRLFQQDPHHPSLGFKQVHAGDSVHSARIGLDYRALAVLRDGHLIWFWIGSHEEYDKLIRQM